MKIKRDDLAMQLERLAPALLATSEVPAHTHLWFDGKHAMSYNGRLGIKLPLKSDVQAGLPGKTLIGLVTGTKQETVELSHGKTAVELKIGGSRVTMAAMDAADVVWPFPDKIPPKAAKIELTEQTLDVLRRLLFVKRPKTVRRTEDNGITLYAGAKNETLMVATNSKVAAQFPVKGGLAKEAEKQVLPREFVEQVVKQGTPEAVLYVLKDCLIMDSPTVRICSAALDCSAVMEIPTLINKYVKQVEGRATVPEGLSEALGRALLLSGNDDDPVIELAVDAKELGVQGVFGLGQLTEGFDLEGKPAGGEITVELEHFNMALAEATEFAVVERGVVLFGDDGFVGVLAGAVK